MCSSLFLLAKGVSIVIVSGQRPLNKGNKAGGWTGQGWGNGLTGQCYARVQGLEN